MFTIKVISPIGIAISAAEQVQVSDPNVAGTGLQPVKMISCYKGPMSDYDRSIMIYPDDVVYIESAAGKTVYTHRPEGLTAPTGA